MKTEEIKNFRLYGIPTVYCMIHILLTVLHIRVFNFHDVQDNEVSSQNKVGVPFLCNEHVTSFAHHS